jgi:hypothetical protein
MPDEMNRRGIDVLRAGVVTDREEKEFCHAYECRRPRSTASRSDRLLPGGAALTTLITGARPPRLTEDGTW